MRQSRLGSFVESLLNMVFGYVISLLVQLAVFPLYGIDVPLHQNIEIVAIFTLTSLLRTYVIRRWFNRGFYKLAEAITKEIE